MPLGHVISLPEGELSNLSGLEDEAAFDEALAQLLKAKLATRDAVDTGNGHMWLERYLLEDKALSQVLTGEDMMRIVFDGEMVVHKNSTGRVATISAALEAVTREHLDSLVESVETEMAAKRAPLQPPSQPGFFARLFGAKPIVAPAPEIKKELDPSLVLLLDEVRALYAKATRDGQAILTTVMV